VGKYYEDLEVGDVSVTAGRTITETDVVMFSALSGDYTPIHTDVEVAAKGPFGQRLVHGPLGFTLAIGLSARLSMFEDTAVAALGIKEWRYLGPLFIGDTVHVEIEVVAKRLTRDPSRGILERRFRLVKQDGSIVQEGILPVMVKARSAA
jgi:acyl dehydratase